MSDPAKQPKKPSIARQVAPWIFAAAIMGYMFYKVDFREVWAVLADPERKPGRIVAAYLMYCLVYYITDVLSFARAYTWFNTPMSIGETTRLRFASFAVQAVNGALTEIMSVLYMYRAKKVPVAHATSAALFVYFNETYTMFALLSICAFLLPPENRIDTVVPVLGVRFWPLFEGLLIAVWAMLPLWLLFWRASSALPKVRNNALLMSFNKGALANYAEIFFYRFFNNSLSVVANIIIIKAIGIEAPLPLLFAVVPIMVNVAYWPVSAGGFGMPQLVALYLLKGYATEAEATAYSLAWSALFFITRVGIGIPFIRGVYRAAFPTQE